ncbi:HEPN domain-containing protein [Candidatus Poribacteria bacterium]|nr:HEPN domain-containing protein [Candidatus Poribacteria bacterium]
MPDRSIDWLRQSSRDIEQARDSQDSGRHEWACFASHQAAEKAIKALHLYMGQDAWGHVLTKLLDELPKSVVVSSELTEKARILDNFYIPTRYPNGHPEGAPFEHYGPLQSHKAIEYVQEIFDFVRSFIKT